MSDEESASRAQGFRLSLDHERQVKQIACAHLVATVPELFGNDLRSRLDANRSTLQ
jgi:hypothetical protein